MKHTRTMAFALAVGVAAVSTFAREPAPGADDPAPEAAAQEGVRLWEDGPFWADRNVGAEAPWESGLYFWWGDTLGYRRENDQWVASDGSASGFAFIQLAGLTPSFGKDPATLRREGWITGDGVLAPEHDAARAKWGRDWRMPTKLELTNLCSNKCDWTWTSTNGVEGYVVRGRGDYADASIFLPAAGRGQVLKRLYNGEWGYLWASDPRLEKDPPRYHSSLLEFGRVRTSDRIGVKGHWDRHLGAPVRPVRGVAERTVPSDSAAGGGGEGKAEPASAPAAAAALSAEPKVRAKGVRLWEGGPVWADRNVGADEPWDEGYFFWWGDAVGYRRENDRWVASDGSVSGFSFCVSNVPTFRMTLSELRRGGWVAENGVLAPEHDAAQVHWGGGWRMPTCQELMDVCYNKCDWAWTTTNGVVGCLVTGRGDYASASIFLPAAGMGNYEGRMDHKKFGDHYGSDPRMDETHCTWRLEFGRLRTFARVDYHWDRFCGVPVRPVRDGAE